MSEESQLWTVRKLLHWTQQHFDKNDIDAPRLTAELLLCHVLSSSRVQLYTQLDRPVEAKELKDYRSLIQRRLLREPTQYITKTREFYKRSFAIDHRALIPRPETELLVDAALQRIWVDSNCRVLDLCSGSGCIGISIALERRLTHVMAVEISADAIALSKENQSRFDLGPERYDIRQGDLFSALDPGTRFEVVVSNPPYVASGELATLQPEVRKEPTLALDGGADGLEFYRKIATHAPKFMTSQGILILEIGDTQGADVKSILEHAKFTHVTIEKDLARCDRILVATAPEIA